MTRRSRTLPAVLATAALASIGLAACGSDDSGDSSSTSSEAASSTEATSTTASGEGSTIKVEADPSGALAFTQTDLTAKAGTDTIEFDNPSSTSHNVEIESSSGDDVAGTDTISAGTTSTTADLQPGTYTFYCSIPGHREAGMEGTITVK